MHAMPKFNMLTILCWPNFSSTQLGIGLVVTEREVCGQGGVTGAEDENFLCAPPPLARISKKGEGGGRKVLFARHSSPLSPLFSSLFDLLRELPRSGWEGEGVR